MTTTDKPVNLEGPEDYCPNCLAWVLHVTDGICPWCEKALAPKSTASAVVRNTLTIADLHAAMKAIDDPQREVVFIGTALETRFPKEVADLRAAGLDVRSLHLLPESSCYSAKAPTFEFPSLDMNSLARARALEEPTYDDLAPAKTPQLRHGWAEHIPSSESAPSADWLPLAVFCGLWLLAIVVLCAIIVLAHLGILDLAGVTL